jgi:hypothetical protein
MADGRAEAFAVKSNRGRFFVHAFRRERKTFRGDSRIVISGKNLLRLKQLKWL